MKEELINWIESERKSADSEYGSHYVGLVNEMLTKFEQKINEIEPDSEQYPFWQ